MIVPVAPLATRGVGEVAFAVPGQFVAVPGVRGGVAFDRGVSLGSGDLEGTGTVVVDAVTGEVLSVDEDV